MSQSATITEETLRTFEDALRENEKSVATIQKYGTVLRRFMVWLDGEELSKRKLLEYRACLEEQGYSAASVNVYLSAIHTYLDTFDLQEFKVKRLKIQRQVFRPEERELTVQEYYTLIRTANALGLERVSLTIQTICGTGIRVSELPYITVEATRIGRAEVSLKGKIRVILIPDRLCGMLQEYAGKEQVESGPIFVEPNGEPITRQEVWGEMKALCKEAGVNPTKVFPHNLRHLFARCFYEETKDISKLADVLGHSSIDTTRIYLISSGMEHAEVINRLNLVI